ncbi:MAG: hypothetical protein ACPG8W_18985 [Candidatus Promineifilaceae bacterium]
MRPLALASTLHDPTGAMTVLLAQTLPELVTLYGVMAVAVTEVTSAEVISLLNQYPQIRQIQGSRNVGESRLNALRCGLTFAELSHFHYCDFDRLVHWWLHFPEELKQTLASVEQLHGYLALGRTTHAFETHPVVQREAEYLTNRVFSWVLGEQTLVHDVVAGSCAMDRVSAEFLVQHSTELSNATDCEWPMLIQHLAKKPLSFLQTEGLAFETPTFFGAQVHQTSFNADNWLNRVRLAKDSIEAAMRVRKKVD